MGNVVINVSTHDNDTKDLNLSLEGTTLKGTLGGKESTVDLSGIIPANTKDRFLKSGSYEQGTKRLILVTGAEGEQDNEVAIPLEDLLGLNLPSTNTGLVIDTSREVKVVQNLQAFTPVKDSAGYVGYMLTDLYGTEPVDVLLPNREGITDVRRKYSLLTDKTTGYLYNVTINDESGYQQEAKSSETLPRVTPLLPRYNISYINIRELTEDDKGKLDGYFPSDQYMAVEAYVQIKIDDNTLDVDLTSKELKRAVIEGNAYNAVGERSILNLLYSITPLIPFDGAYEVAFLDSRNSEANEDTVTYNKATQVLSYRANKYVTFLVKKSGTDALAFFTKLRDEKENSSKQITTGHKITFYFTDGSDDWDYLDEPRSVLPISGEYAY